MRHKLPTILILLAMVAVGVVYWVDLTYFYDFSTGFVKVGSVWQRYALLLVPLGLALWGLRTVGPHAVGVMRLPHRRLGVLFMLAALAGFVTAACYVADGLQPLSVLRLGQALMMLWYGVWMILAGLQLINQRTPSPTKSAFWGLLAALPFCAQTMYRVLVKPASLYRVVPLIRIFAALFAMLWFGMLIRSLYIAMVRRRVRWMYLFGVLTFLLCSCMELPQTVYSILMRDTSALAVAEAVNLGVLGLIAGCVSVAISGSDSSAARVVAEESLLPPVTKPRPPAKSTYYRRQEPEE